jgi:branched-chain amino acid transport system substrate-binding protein
LKTTGAGLGALSLSSFLGFSQAALAIRIGLIDPLLLPVGTAATRGATIAVDELNAAGGILGRPFKIDSYIKDDGLDTSVGPQNFEALVVEDQVLAVVGGFLDEVTLAIVDTVLPRLRTPFLNTGSASPETTNRVISDYDNFKYYFRLMLDTDILTADTVNAAAGVLGKEVNVTSAGILVEDGIFGRDFQSFLETKLPGVGIEVPEGASFRFPESGSFDFDSILSQSKDAGVEAFIIAFARNDGVGFVTQWFNQGPRVPVLGINVSGQAFEYYSSTLGKVVSHVYADAATGATAITEKTLPFYASYVSRYTTPPVQPLFTGYTTYDSIYILKQAIERIGETPPATSDEAGYSAYKAQLVAAIEQTDIISTVGHVRFQGRSDPKPHNPFTTDAQGNVYVVPKWIQWQVEQGKADRKVVWPTEYKNSQFVPPPPQS